MPNMTEKKPNRKMIPTNRKLGGISETMRPRAKRMKIWAICMPNMAEKAEQEVGTAKQEVRSYLGNRGYIYSIHMPNKAKKAKQEVSSAKQEKTGSLRYKTGQLSVKARGPLVLFIFPGLIK